MKTEPRWRRVASVLLVLVLHACSAAPTREEVLRTLVVSQLLPDMKALARASAELSERVAALSEGAGSLSAAQAAWCTALLAWERVYAFRFGPIVDNSGLLRARFWPIREAALQRRLAEPEPIDETSVERTGVDLRGMYALEWLLFAAPSRTLVEATPEGKRARLAARAFAVNVQGYAERALAQLGDGSALVDTLGASAQESVSRLVNQMIGTVETLASDRLATVLELHTHDNLRASEIQAAPSKLSCALVLAQLSATEALYLGRRADGLRVLVAPVAPRIDERVRARFAEARGSLERLGAPLELSVVRDRARVQAAFDALKQLELALKVDLASALGVTLSFTAGDGD